MMKKNFIHVGAIILVMWGVFIISSILPIIKSFGIIPRSSMGLIGVVSAPFLHANLNHIIGNTVALLTFAPIFVLVVGKNSIEKITILTVLTGFLTWCFAFPGNHIGASGLVFALYGYLICLGFLQRKIQYMALSVAIICIYGYMMLGVFPLEQGVSWESHLMGVVAGGILAKFRP